MMKPAHFPGSACPARFPDGCVGSVYRKAAWSAPLYRHIRPHSLFDSIQPEETGIQVGQTIQIVFEARETWKEKLCAPHRFLLAANPETFYNFSNS
ncbi:hypothetical protein [Undibacterium sp.]|jgi:hypothetical protein|uniref:hypothetical protein n=1 Tax=Undibacterium sp. TaxID=1914977 RepID=UPI002CD6ED09|nr:hypothetical protein [Undibacterium sp.]HTD05011.1 hypothetical protein [Undibacterium sp.]